MRPEVLIRPQLRYAGAAACAAVILVGGGWAMTTHYSQRVFLLMGVIAVTALAVAERGVFLGVLVLAVMNGLPFLDTSHSLVHHIAIQDAASLAFIGITALWTIGRGRAAPVSPLTRVVSGCGLALFLWCAFTVVRTTVDGNVPILGAIRYGRDFLYFGALLIFLPRLRLPAREVQRLLVVLVVGVCLFSVGQIVTGLGIGHVTWLVHANLTARTLGLTRVYSPMNDLLSAGIAGGVAAIALARDRARMVAIPVTLLLTTSLLIQLTRARWIGMIGGLVLVSLWFALRGEHRVAQALRRRLARMGMGLAGVVALFLVAAPSAGTPLANRFLSIFTDVGSTNVKTSTVATREHLASLMTGVLGGHWLLGLGLIPPAVHYYLALPMGSLRQGDVGTLNAIVTIGAIGAVLIYLPVVAVLVGGLRRPPAGEATRSPWIVYGGAIFIVTTLISSVTLGTLFSVGGLVLTAVVLSLMVQAAESTRIGSEPAEEEGRAAASESFAPVFPLAGVVAGSEASFGASEPAQVQAPGGRLSIDLGFEWEVGDRLADLRSRTPIEPDRGTIPSGHRPLWDDRPGALADLNVENRNGGSHARPHRSDAARARHRLLIPGGVLIAALLGFLLARAVLGPGKVSTHAPQHASAGPLSVAYPAGWSQRTPPAAPAFGVTDELALAPPAAEGGLLVVGRGTTLDSSFLPPSLHQAIPRLGTAQLTLLAGARAYRYLDQSVTGLAGPVTIYAIPTADGTILGFCETQGAAPAFAAWCERTLATTRLASGAPVAAPPSAGYDSALSAILTKLNVRRSRGGAALASARTPRSQAAAAAVLAAAHLRAATAVGKLSAGSAQPANRAVSGALRSVGNAYRALGAAAARNDARGYAAARSLVSAANGRFSAAVSRLGKLGTSAG